MLTARKGEATVFIDGVYVFSMKILFKGSLWQKGPRMSLDPWIESFMKLKAVG
jgi:hypothetical protein